MSTASLTPARRGVLRHSRVGRPAGRPGRPCTACLLLAVPAAPVVAVGLWWNSNTVAHYFLHRPFFRCRALNVAFALYLSVLLGVPQTLWRDRHLAHHAGRPWRLRLSRSLCVESALVLALWAALLALAPAFFLTAYLPGYVRRPGAVLAARPLRARRRRHHQPPRVALQLPLPQRRLSRGTPCPPRRALDPAAGTRRPGGAAQRLAGGAALAGNAVARTAGALVLRSPRLQRFLLDRHERAFAALLPRLPAARRVAIVGGGLWPRTVLVLRRLLPAARLVVIDRSAENLATARPLLPADVEVINDFYDPVRMKDFDLVVIPLAFVGDREALYRDPPAPALLVHDWIWRRRGAGAVVSWLLLKRLNLVTPCVALSLFLVFVTAKLLVLAGRRCRCRRGRRWPTSGRTRSWPWRSPGSTVCCDAGRGSRGRSMRSLAGYTALNVPLACLLSTPLTWPLLRATGGTIADSIGHHVTAANLLPGRRRAERPPRCCPVCRARLSPPVAARGRSPCVAVVCCCRSARWRRRGWRRTGCTATRWPPWSRRPCRASRPPTWPATGRSARWAARRVTTCPACAAGPRAQRRRRPPRIDRRRLSEALRRGRRPHATPDRAEPNRRSCSRMPTRPIPKPSGASSPRSAPSSRRSTRRAEDYEPAHAPALARRPRASSGYRTGLFHPGRFRYLGMEEAAAEPRLRTRARTPATSAASTSRASASTRRRRCGACWRGSTKPPGEPFLLTYLPIAGHHPYDDARASPVPRRLGHRPLPQRPALRRRFAGRNCWTDCASAAWRTTRCSSSAATTARRSASTRATTDIRCSCTRKTCVCRS